MSNINLTRSKFIETLNLNEFDFRWVLYLMNSLESALEQEKFYGIESVIYAFVYLTIVGKHPNLKAKKFLPNLSVIQNSANGLQYSNYGVIWYHGDRIFPMQLSMEIENNFNCPPTLESNQIDSVKERSERELIAEIYLNLIENETGSDISSLIVVNLVKIRENLRQLIDF